MITVRMNAQLHKAIKGTAAIAGKSMEAWIRQTLIDELQQTATEVYRMPTTTLRREIPAGLVEHLRKRLGPAGHKFFLDLLRNHAEINVVLQFGKLPHTVHFHEGMAVRNEMRASGYCDDWTDHDFDNLWAIAVCRAILPDERAPMPNEGALSF